MSPPSPPEWSVSRLNRRIEASEPFFILDVRNRDEFEAGPIEGRGPIPTANVPYFEMLEMGGADDLVESVVRYARSELVEEIPRDRPVLAVCARGDTSRFVAEALGRLGYDASNLTGGARAWGDHYEVRPVLEEGPLTVWQVQRPARGCLSHVVASRGRALVVDPLRHLDRYTELSREQGLTCEAVVDTHAHADHISGGSELASSLGVPYLLHPYDGIHPLDLLPASVDFDYLSDDRELRVGEARLRTLHVPGHTLGNVAFEVDHESLPGRLLLSGDSIFLRSIARPDLGGRSEDWARLHHGSLRRLLELPDDTLVLPGHFSSREEADEDGRFMAPLGELRTSNEGLRMAARPEAEFVDYILSSLPDFPEEYIDIKRVNAGLLEPDEERASELELGRNLCALSPAHDLSADPTNIRARE